MPASPFSDDAGTADPALRAALAAWAEDRTRQRPVLEALRTARLLVPVVAVRGESEGGENGLRR
ncbi:SseB family protein, partial [Streptomyces sp. PGLac3x]